MSAVFVTATGTDIGKTFVTAALVRTLRSRGRPVSALKPVLSGFGPDRLADSDTGVLLAALGLDLTEDHVAQISPWRFAAPLSPDMAARREGRAVAFDDLVAFCRQRIAAMPGTLLIEGVGGVMVPLDERHTVLDWINALEIPALLVAGSYLGAISHTLTALAVLRGRAVPVAAIVINETPGSTVDLEETSATIRRFTGITPVLVLPRLNTVEPADFEHITALL
jgi:dethiobiotin synthetase